MINYRGSISPQKNLWLKLLMRSEKNGDVQNWQQTSSVTMASMVKSAPIMQIQAHTSNPSMTHNVETSTPKS